MSLGTGDLGLARLRGLMLDAEFDRNVLMLAAGHVMRVPDRVVAPLRTTDVDAPEDLIARLVGFALDADLAGFDEPLDLPPDLARDACREIGGTPARRRIATFRGAAEE
jgi:hypothetical protein